MRDVGIACKLGNSLPVQVFLVTSARASLAALYGNQPGSGLTKNAQMGMHRLRTYL